MAQRKSFLLRLPDDLLEALNRWAGDELRSVNAQIEYILREAVRKRGGDRAAASGMPPGETHSTDLESPATADEGEPSADLSHPTDNPRPSESPGRS